MQTKTCNVSYYSKNIHIFNLLLRCIFLLNFYLYVILLYFYLFTKLLHETSGIFQIFKVIPSSVINSLQWTTLSSAFDANDIVRIKKSNVKVNEYNYHRDIFTFFIILKIRGLSENYDMLFWFITKHKSFIALTYN